MSENQKRILQMLAEGKISVDEATRLLSLMGDGENVRHEEANVTKENKFSPKYLYIRVEPKVHSNQSGDKEHQHFAEHGKVNVRVPLGLIRAGIKLKALIPPQVADDVNRAMKEKGIGFDIRDLKDEYIEGLVTALTETEINVDSEEAEVRIYAE